MSGPTRERSQLDEVELRTMRSQWGSTARLAGTISTPRPSQSRTGLEEQEVVGQMGPVEAGGLEGSRDQLEGHGRCGLQEAPQWFANCACTTPGERWQSSSQVNQRHGDLHVCVAPIALDGNDAQTGLGCHGFVLLD